MSIQTLPDVYIDLISRIPYPYDDFILIIKRYLIGKTFRTIQIYIHFKTYMSGILQNIRQTNYIPNTNCRVASIQKIPIDLYKC